MNDSNARYRLFRLDTFHSNYQYKWFDLDTSAIHIMYTLNICIYNWIRYVRNIIKDNGSYTTTEQLTTVEFTARMCNYTPIFMWMKITYSCLNLGDGLANLQDDVIKWEHFPRYWAFVRGIHQPPVNSPHKGRWRETLMCFFYLRLNKPLSKQSRGWWFETPSHPLWGPW